MFAVIDLAFNQQHSLSYVDLVIGLVAATLIGLCIMMIYRTTHNAINYDRTFLLSIVLICPIVSLIIALIGSNLSLSLGMVGALSIIRFRTVIKDSRDMIYLFWGIAVGLGCGTNNVIAVLMASLIIGCLLLIFSAFKIGDSKKASYVIVLSGSNERPVNEISQLLDTHTSHCQQRSSDLTDNNWETVFEIELKDSLLETENKLLAGLKQLPNITKASLLSPMMELQS